MFSMFLMSFLGEAASTVLVGLNSLGLTLRSNEAGEVHEGGEAGGLHVGLLFGVKLLKADGPPPLGECIEEAIEVLSDDATEDAFVDTLGYGEYLCCLSL